ncbi:MAG: PAS domain S-box protein [Ignavibacteria bacterium]
MNRDPAAEVNSQNRFIYTPDQNGVPDIITPSKKNLSADLAWMIIVFTAYFCLGKLGLKLAFENISATAFWPPTGLAIAVFLLRGYKLWPAVIAGAFLVNFTTTGDLVTSIFIAAGNTAEGLLAAYLVNRYAAGKFAFNKIQNIFRYVLYAGAAATMVSAVTGVTSLAIKGFVQWDRYPAVWLTWWLGDMTGALLIGPLLILWFHFRKFRWDKNKFLEGACITLLIAFICVIEFTPYSIAAAKHYPFSYIIIPPFVWIAFRYNQRFAATAAFFVSVVALWGTLNGYGPFIADNANNSLLFLQSFICIVTVMSVSFASMITEKHKIELRIRNSENMLRDFVENASIGMQWIDPEGIILWANKTEMDLLGYKKENYIGRHFSEFHNDKIIACEIMERLAGNEKLENFEVKLICKNGSIKTILLSSEVYRINGKFVHSRCFSRDITEIKLMEAALRSHRDALHEAEKRRKQELENILETLPAGAYTCDHSGLITYYNKKAVQIWGREPKLNDPMDRYCGSFKLYIGNETVKHNECWTAKAIMENKCYNGEEIIVEQPSGRRLTVMAHANLLYDESGILTGAVNMLVDITDRKNLETALRESEQRFQAIFKQVSVGIAQFDLDGKFVLVNDRYCEIIGRTQNEVLNLNFRDITHPDDYDNSAELFSRMITEGRDYIIEKRYLKPDGSLVWIKKSVSLIRDNAGTPLFVVAICSDVTEQKRAEESLRSSEEEFRHLFDLAGVGKALTDVQSGKFLRVNDRFCELLGYSFDELSGKTLHELKHINDNGKFTEQQSKVLSGEIQEFSVEERLIRKDGSPVWVITTSSALRDENKKPVKFVNIMQYIQDRKLAENYLNVQYSVSKALNESLTFSEASQKILRSICEGIGWQLGTIWTVDPEKELLKFEDSWSSDETEITDSGMAEPGRTFEKGIGLPGRVWQMNKPCWIPDVTRDNNFPRVKNALNANLHAGFAFPISNGGKVIAVIECFNKKILEPKQELLDLLNASGRQIGNFLVRRRAEVEREIAQNTYRSLFENSLDGILIVDDKGKYLNVNESYAKMLKADRDYLIGQDFKKFIPPDLLPSAIEKFSGLKENKQTGRTEFPLMAVDGTLVELEWISRSNFLPGMHFCVARDISERKLSEIKLHEEYSFRKAIEDSVASGIAAVNTEGVQTYVNPSFCRMVGWTEDELVGAKPPYVYWPPEEYDNIIKAFERTLSGNIPGEGFELKFCRKNGELFEVLVSVSSILNKEGEVINMLASVTDITEIKKTEKQLKEINDRLDESVKERTRDLNILVEEMKKEIKERMLTEEKLKKIHKELKETQDELINSEKLASLGRFSAGIAHEIRNPLANISALAQLLVKKNLDSNVTKHLKYILINSDIANRIIKELLNIASPHNINFAEDDIDRIINNLCELVKTRCSRNNIIINKKLSRNLPLLSFNREKIQAAFLNFISNAIEAMPEGGTLNISSEFLPDSNEVKVIFEDTGIGIEEANIDKITEPFFTTKSEGTGLGLSLAYEVIRAHSGRIEIESKIGHGTKIIIKLPVTNGLSFN